MACYHKEKVEALVVMARVVVGLHMNGRQVMVEFGDAMKVDYDDDSVVLCHNHLEVAMHDNIQELEVDFLSLVGNTLLALLELLELPGFHLSLEVEGASKQNNLGQEPRQTLQVAVVVPYVVDKVVGSTQQAVVAEVIV